MMKRVFTTFLVLVCALLSLSAVTSGEILDCMEERMDFESAVFSATLVNTDRFGETTLSFDTYQKGDGDTLLTVTSGSDRGQKILRLGDEIYVYYPDADETIRLSSSGLKDSFLGSDFSYEDVTGDDDYDKRYTHTLLDDETVDGRECYTVSLKAKKSSETYQTQIIWVDRETLVPVKMELSSRSGKLLKTVRYSDYITDGDTYFPGRIEIVNAVKKNSSSVMTVDTIEFDTVLDDSLFDIGELSW